MWLVLTLASSMLYAAQWAVVRASHQKVPSSFVAAAHGIAAPVLALGVLRHPMPLDLPIVQIYLVYVFLINPPFSWISIYAAQRIPLSLSKPLSSFASVSATLAGWLAFDLRFPPLGIAGITLGFVGLWLLYHARGNAWKQPYPWLLALCMLNFGLVSALTGQVLAVYPHPVIVTGIGLTGALTIAGAVSARQWRRLRVRRETVGILGFIALSNILSEVLYSMALGMIPAAYAVSTKRVSIIITALLGYYLFRERELPLWRLLAASALVAAGVALMALR